LRFSTTRRFELKVQIGRRLIRAKEILPHGQFIPWAKSEFGWTQSNVRRHMELARNHSRVNDLAPTASLRTAAAISTTAYLEALHTIASGWIGAKICRCSAAALRDDARYTKAKRGS